MRKQKKNSGSLVIIMLVCSFVLIVTSCLEVTQHISMNGNVIRTNTRLAVQKSLFILSDSFGAGVSMDDFPIDSIDDGIPKNYIKSIEIIDTEQEYGTSITLEYSANDTAQLEKRDDSFLFPIKQGNKIILSVTPTELDYASDSYEMMWMILSSYKYRLYISKSVLAEPNWVTITRNDIQFNATLIAYQDFAVLELPITILFGDEPFQIIIE